MMSSSDMTARTVLNGEKVLWELTDVTDRDEEWIIVYNWLTKRINELEKKVK